MRPLTPQDGWCDDPNAPQYNQWVDLRTFDLAVTHEKLWRDDAIYDVIIVVGYNDDPTHPGRGSAIFIHVARPDYEGTAGCVALNLEDLLEIVHQLGVETTLTIESMPPSVG